jgi:hypothetical protein
MRKRGPGVLVTSTLAILNLTLACGGATGRRSIDGPDTHACAAPAAHPGLAFASPTHVFVNGGIAEQDGVLVIAGLEEDAAPQSDARRSAGRAVRVYHESTGEVAAPGARAGRPPLSAPVPVVHASGEWGIVWAEAMPHASSHSWPDDRFTELWSSRREGDGWAPPVLLAQASLRIDWPTVRTVRQSAGRGTLLMTMVEEHTAERHIVLGPAGEPLRRVPLDASSVP